jgi:RNA polymerase sigma-32 factor
VRQIEVRAFEKLQKAMKAQIAERRLQSQSAVAARQASSRQVADH